MGSPPLGGGVYSQVNSRVFIYQQGVNVKASCCGHVIPPPLPPPLPVPINRIPGRTSHCLPTIYPSWGQRDQADLVRYIYIYIYYICKSPIKHLLLISIYYLWNGSKKEYNNLLCYFYWFNFIS